jgi:hypothetical protein
MKLYKSMCKGLKSNYDLSQWEIGKWRNTECTELCHGFNASKNIIDAMGHVNMGVLALVETKGKSFKSDDKITTESMRILRAWEWEKEDSVSLAIYAAELVIDNFERVYPDDKRPRNAIEAAKNYLKNPTAESAARAERAERAASAAESAESAARSAESAAWSAASAESAWSAAWSAASAARAESAARSAAWSAASAASARSAAWSAESAEKTKKQCHKWVIKHIPKLKEIK